LSARLRDAGETDAAVRYLLLLLKQDCYNEQAHRSLIEVLLDSGHLDQARHHYQDYIRRMTEVDVHPNPIDICPIDI
jgi:DNA-binding SARP family transcriptional activator